MTRRERYDPPQAAIDAELHRQLRRDRDWPEWPVADAPRRGSRWPVYLLAFASTLIAVAGLAAGVAVGWSS